jgi:predicted nucleotidyltransferase
VRLKTAADRRADAKVSPTKSKFLLSGASLEVWGGVPVATQQQFKDLLSDIEPSKTTKEKASKAHEGPREFLGTHEVFQEYLVNTFLSGSYARHTAIRPRVHDGKEDRADIDVIVLTNHTKEDEPEDVIKLLFDTLKKKYNVKRAVRSVRITTNDFYIDIVPVIAPDGEGGTLYIPDGDLADWVETNPPGHTQWTTEVNEQAEGRFKPLVKLMKWWRRQNPTGYKKPKGFVIECLVAGCMDYRQTQYQELFVGTLEQIVRRYRPYVNWGMVPPIQDPAVSGNSVTKGMEFVEFKAFIEMAEKHAHIGRQAINEEDPEKETERWRQIFGGRFPACKSRALESLLTTAPPSRSILFPDKPIDPTKKPRGFA